MQAVHTFETSRRKIRNNLECVGVDRARIALPPSLATCEVCVVLPSSVNVEVFVQFLLCITVG